MAELPIEFGMNTLLDYPLPSLTRYSAKNNLKPVTFICRASAATEVYLVGDFNGWNSVANPMKRQVDGAWRLEILLCHGHHQYRFLVDGKPTLDPIAYGTARNEKNEEVSLLAVS
jgi:1,4-alpha-glucan branching enzyme